MSERSYQIRSWAYQELFTVDRCAYCGLRGSATIGPDKQPWHLDHVWPLSKGGSDSVGNLVKACASCNVKKGAKKWPVRPNTRFGDGSVMRRDGTRTPAVWEVYESDHYLAVWDTATDNLETDYPTWTVFL